jgi:hypothetical protein
LATESNFSPVDGKFACAALNSLGQVYWKLSHGGEECRDPVVIRPSQPLILNAEGSVISASVPLQWGVTPGQEMGTHQVGAWSLVEFFRDSSATQLLLHQDSLKTNSMLVSLPSGTALTWVRVKFRDTLGLESPWSLWKKLNWAAAPVTRLLAGPVVGFSLKAAGGGRSMVIMRITLSMAAAVRVQILDARGQTRRTLFQGHLEAGSHAFPFDGRGGHGKRIGAGTYFCRFQANGETRTIPTQIPP